MANPDIESKPRTGQQISIDLEIDRFKGVLRDSIDSLKRNQDPNARIGAVGVVSVYLWDMIDAIDHLTADETGGTPAIQNFASDNRRVARDFLNEKRDSGSI